MNLRAVWVLLGVTVVSPAQTLRRSVTEEAQLRKLIQTSPPTAVLAAPDLSDVYRGTVDVSIADDLDNGTSTTIYRFEREGLAVSAYQPSASAPQVRCGDVVTLKGIRLGDAMAVEQARVDGQAQGEGQCSSTGLQKVAVILVTFPGGRPPSTTAGPLQGLLFNPSGLSAHTWYQQASYGKVSLAGSVFGPYTLDRAYTCSETSQMRAAAIRAADRDIDFSQFQRYVLIFPGIRNCAFGAMATLGCSEMTTNDGTVQASWVWSNDFNDSSRLMDLLIHELGHNLGVGHSKLLRFPGESLGADDFRAVPLEYGDPTATMGRGRYGDFAAAHKVEMGWLDKDAHAATVEGDGDFLLAPLNGDYGVRALRIRRRAGADEWLWVEHRRFLEGSAALTRGGTHQGFDGVLVRRETAESGTVTHLLDMTPASLDEARFDMGAASEAFPELPFGSTWSDPHSDLTIKVGDAGPDGIPVRVRYVERCAVPSQGEIRFTASAQEAWLAVASTEGCNWTVASGRSWLRAWRGDGDAATQRATVQVSEVTDNFHRTGVVTIGRSVVKVTQKGPPLDMQILSVSPPGADLPVNAPIPFLFYLRDDNGVEDMQALQLSVLPGLGSAAVPCYFRYPVVRRVVEVSDNGVEFRDDETSNTGRSGACTLQASTFRVNGTDLIFRFSLLFAGGEGENLTLSVRAEDTDGVAGPWIPATGMTTVNHCRALPAVDYFLYLAGGGTNQGLTIRASSSPCAWSASTDADWIRLHETGSADGGTLRFDIAANAGPATREGRILVNGAPVRVIQHGKDEIQQNYVTLRPTETVVSGNSGVGSLVFSYGLGDLVPAEAESAWLQVVRVERNADGREIVFLYEANPEAAPRLGTILVGGKRFTVVQEPGPLP